MRDLKMMADNNKILKVLTGSNLYGTNTPDSDFDYAGIMIADKRYYLGLDSVEEVDCSIVSKQVTGKNDKDAVDFKLYEFRKFVRLAMGNNPNILEILFAPQSNIVFKNEFGQRLLDNAHLFPYRGLKQKFLGYAFTQKHKMVIKTDNYTNLTMFGSWLLDNLRNPREDHKIEGEFYSNQLLAELREKSIPGVKFYEHHALVGDINISLTDNLSKVETKIRSRLSKVGNREELYTKYGYDCYHENTEFLTNRGWKLYDEVEESDLLGTINPKTKRLEFQSPYERIKKHYIGDMYEFVTNYSQMCVTPNHRMFVSDCHRNKQTNFSTEYVESNSNWKFEPLYSLIDGDRSYFHTINSLIYTNDKDMSIDDDYLRLMGFYLSEGCVGKRNKKGDVKSIRICQTNKGKDQFITIFNSFAQKFDFSLYTYERKDKTLVEYIWISYNEEIRQSIIKDCGEKENKHLPSWIYQLSKRQCDILLECLILGDGCSKNDFTYVYYTKYKKLANDIQILAFLAGRNVNLCGAYKSVSNYTKNPLKMYQVSFSKVVGIPKSLYVNPSPIIKSRKAGGVTHKYDGNIVCFSVPNELLITRYNGKIAIQGNTKFGMHLVRLMLEGKELLTTGKLEYPLKDRQMLLDIRAGKWDSKDIIAYSNELEAEIEALGETSPLPSSPRYDEIETFLINMVEEFWSR
jgi:hypothetical protein